MSQDYLQRVLRDAARLGTPCVLRVGNVTAVCSSVTAMADGTVKGETVAHSWPNAGKAREFVSRAVHESGWKCAQHVDPPTVYPSPGGVA